MREPPGSSPPWWVDLVHPLPIAAATALLLNDHALKGSGLLPAAWTGKLSDVAGLFVFPVIVVACLRWAAETTRAPRRPLARSPRLAWSVAALTGLAFAGVKLVPAVNRVASDLLGPNVMDPTDLFALVALAPAAIWMSRRVAPPPATRRPPDPSRATRTVTAAFVALACAATSSKKEPIMPSPARAAAAVVSRQAPCARLSAVTCRYDATRFVVRLSAQKQDSRTCNVTVAAFRPEGTAKADNGTLVEAPTFEVTGGEAALFGAWGRFAQPGQTWESAHVWINQRGHDRDGPIERQTDVQVACRPGFGEDTTPPTEVAQ